MRLAERLEAGALARAQAEQADIEAAAKAAAIEALIAGYKSTSADLTDAIDRSLSSLRDLLNAAQAHNATPQSALLAAGLVGRAVPGYGQLQTPDPVQVINAVQALAAKSFGLAPTVSYPHLLVQPIEPFLLDSVSVR